MKRCWEPKKVTSVFTEITDRDYEQRLAEVAEIFYDLFCQFRKIESCTSGQPTQEIELRKTGSDD
jgi:hypothetical protein